MIRIYTVRLLYENANCQPIGLRIGVLESSCVSPINIYIYSLHLFAILSSPLSYLRMSVDSLRMGVEEWGVGEQRK